MVHKNLCLIGLTLFLATQVVVAKVGHKPIFLKAGDYNLSKGSAELCPSEGQFKEILDDGKTLLMLGSKTVLTLAPLKDSEKVPDGCLYETVTDIKDNILTFQSKRSECQEKSQSQETLKKIGENSLEYKFKGQGEKEFACRYERVISKGQK